jgi:hypothetical protein
MRSITMLLLAAGCAGGDDPRPKTTTYRHAAPAFALDVPADATPEADGDELRWGHDLTVRWEPPMIADLQGEVDLARKLQDHFEVRGEGELAGGGRWLELYLENPPEDNHEVWAWLRIGDQQVTCHSSQRRAAACKTLRPLDPE